MLFRSLDLAEEQLPDATLGTASAPVRCARGDSFVARAQHPSFVLPTTAHAPAGFTPPLTILVASDGERWTFELDEASKVRVPPVPDTQAGTARVRVPFDVADDFRAVHGSLYPHVAEWLTHLSREDLARLGGIQFLHDGQRVWNLPARRDGRP